MNWEEHKESIISIIELIEDKQYPAKRNITDYVCQIFGYPKELDDFIQKEYEKFDKVIN